MLPNGCPLVTELSLRCKRPEVLLGILSARVITCPWRNSKALASCMASNKVKQEAGVPPGAVVQRGPVLIQLPCTVTLALD